MFSFLDNLIKSRNEWLSMPYYHYPNPNFKPKQNNLDTNSNQ